MKKQSNKFYTMLAAVRTWFRANFQDYPYWRVTYKDGKRTRLLYWGEAHSLKQVFGGKLCIDYEYCS